MIAGSLCSGYAGLEIALGMLWDTELAWTAENDPDCATILAHHYPGVPNHGDIEAVDWACAQPVDILTAGFPCQDVSCAGQRKGLRAGTRTGVWAHVARAIKELRPGLVVLENVRGLLSADADSDMEPCALCVGETGHEHSLRAAGAVCGDLADLLYDARGAVVPASAAGAPHRRDRVFILAWPANPGSERPGPRDSEGTTADERPAPWRPRLRPGNGTHPAANTGDGADTERAWDQGRPAGQRPPERGKPGTGGEDAANPAGARPAGPAGAGVEGTGRLPVQPVSVDWGAYRPAITRWETILGRPAPAPSEPGRDGKPRLSPRFAEWMMGLPEGWVTSVPGLSRNAQLKALGNGVCPQQAALAITLLLEDL